MASAVDKATMSASDVAKIDEYRKQWNEANARGDQAAMDAAHNAAQALRATYGYQGDKEGNGGNPPVKYEPEYIEPELIDSVDVDVPKLTDTMQKYIKEAQAVKLEDSTAAKQSMKDMLDEQKKQQEEQVKAQTDYAVEQGVKAYERAQEDAIPQFQEQRDQIDADEAKAKDNAALYAQMRGDRGGIGQAQYSQIMAAAAQNRQTVNAAQTKLATDTARSIADLRAQGEFEKADKLLTISQNYLSQLMSLEQWAMNYDMSVAQFNESVRQWVANFAMSCAQADIDVELTIAQLNSSIAQANANIINSVNEFNANLANDAQQYAISLQEQQRQQLSKTGTTLLNAGIMPTDEQLTAMGFTKNQASSYISALQASAKASKGGGTDSALTFAEPTKLSFTANQALENFNTGNHSAPIIASLISAGMGEGELTKEGVTKAEYEAGKVMYDQSVYGANYYYAKSYAENAMKQGTSKKDIFAYLYNNGTKLTEDGYEAILGDPSKWK